MKCKRYIFLLIFIVPCYFSIFSFAEEAVIVGESPQLAEILINPDPYLIELLSSLNIQKPVPTPTNSPEYTAFLEKRDIIRNLYGIRDTTAGNEVAALIAANVPDENLTIAKEILENKNSLALNGNTLASPSQLAITALHCPDVACAEKIKYIRDHPQEYDCLNNFAGQFIKDADDALKERGESPPEKECCYSRMKADVLKTMRSICPALFEGKQCSEKKMQNLYAKLKSTYGEEELAEFPKKFSQETEKITRDSQNAPTQFAVKTLRTLITEPTLDVMKAPCDFLNASFNFQISSKERYNQQMTAAGKIGVAAGGTALGLSQSSLVTKLRKWKELKKLRGGMSSTRLSDSYNEFGATGEGWFNKFKLRKKEPEFDPLNAQIFSREEMDRLLRINVPRLVGRKGAKVGDHILLRSGHAMERYEIQAIQGNGIKVRSLTNPEHSGWITKDKIIDDPKVFIKNELFQEENELILKFHPDRLKSRTNGGISHDFEEGDFTVVLTSTGDRKMVKIRQINVSHNNAWVVDLKSGQQTLVDYSSFSGSVRTEEVTQPLLRRFESIKRNGFSFDEHSQVIITDGLSDRAVVYDGATQHINEVKNKGKEEILQVMREQRNTDNGIHYISHGSSDGNYYVGPNIDEKLSVDEVLNALGNRKRPFYIDGGCKGAACSLFTSARVEKLYKSNNFGFVIGAVQTTNKHDAILFRNIRDMVFSNPLLFNEGRNSIILHNIAGEPVEYVFYVNHSVIRRFNPTPYQHLVSAQ